MARALFVQPEIHDPAELNFKWVVRVEEGREGAEDRREARAAAGVKEEKEGKRNPLQLGEKLMMEHAAPYIPAFDLVLFILEFFAAPSSRFSLPPFLILSGAQ
jgi:hypothetical protein